jgi:uncharacterized protein (TIGR03086 family)
MTATNMTVPQAHPTGPLAQAISYALRAVHDVTPSLLRRPTPCHAWDLDTLLRHASESLAALCEGIGTATISLFPATQRDGTGDPARVFHDQARRLRQAWATTGRRRELINIAGSPLPVSLMEAAGALEIAIHAWDISQASGHYWPIPPALASHLLAIAPLLVPPTGRHPLFAAPVAVPPDTSPSGQLVAFFGRTPDGMRRSGQISPRRHAQRPSMVNAEPPPLSTQAPA